MKVSNSHSDTPWPILAARPVVEFINRVDEADLATIMWHSTWQDESNKVGKAIGLNEFAVLEAPEYEGWHRRAPRVGGSYRRPGRF